MKKKLCKDCIDGPENFSTSFIPLSECFENGWHVHLNGKEGDYMIFKDL